MEMHQIRYFLTVCKTLNFTRAAEECNVAQPSLTRAIKKLEAELGGDLFLRERARTHISELGRTMQPLLAKSYENVVTAKSRAEQYNKVEIAHLRLGLSHSIDARIVMSALNEISQALPDLDIHIIRGCAEDIEKHLEDGRIELAITANDEPGWSRIDHWPLFSEGFQVAMSARHQLAKQNSIKLEQFVGERVLMRTHCEQEAAFIALLNEHQLSITHRHEIGSEGDQEILLSSGLGVGMIPNSIGLSSDNIVKLPLEDINVCRSLVLLAVAGRKYSEPAGLLIKLLRSADWTEYEN